MGLGALVKDRRARIVWLTVSAQRVAVLMVGDAHEDFDPLVDALIDRLPDWPDRARGRYVRHIDVAYATETGARSKRFFRYKLLTMDLAPGELPLARRLFAFELRRFPKVS